MKIAIELNDKQYGVLGNLAQEYQLKPEQLANALISDILSQSKSDFKNALDYILEKNHELYKRLSK